MKTEMPLCVARKLEMLWCPIDRVIAPMSVQHLCLRRHVKDRLMSLAFDHGFGKANRLSHDGIYILSKPGLQGVNYRNALSLSRDRCGYSFARIGEKEVPRLRSRKPWREKENSSKIPYLMLSVIRRMQMDEPKFASDGLNGCMYIKRPRIGRVCSKEV